MSPLATLRTAGELVRFSHTVFALPFALIAALAAAGGLPAPGVLGWIVVAMVGARTAAMAFNRLADHAIDAANPRTAGRPLPTGRLSRGFAWGLVVVGGAALVGAAWRLNPLCLALSPLALVWVLGYSYSKRFLALSHLWLGVGLGIAPVGAWLAVRGSFALPPIVLALAVTCWVAGFDVLYALQDEAFDRERGLFSVPARFGTVGALWFSGALHVATLVGLAALPFVYPQGLGVFYWVGVAGCAALLAYQHAIVKPGDLSRLNAAFFTANGVLAVWLFAAVVADRLL